jgi:hypothetical protein
MTDYISSVFQSAAQLYNNLGQLGANAVFVTASLTSNEMAGTVSYAGGNLVYQPGQIIRNPQHGKFQPPIIITPAVFTGPVEIEVNALPQLLNTATSNGGSQPFDFLQPYDSLAITVSQLVIGGSVSVSITSINNNVLGASQFLTNVNEVASVLCGVGTGIAAGSSALYTLSLANPQAVPIFR